jgi:hypothetical protein
VVTVFSGGPVRHMIDFAAYEASAGDVLWIRPGQVHRFSQEAGYRGTVPTMQPGFPPRATVEATGLYRYDPPPLLHPDAAGFSRFFPPGSSIGTPARHRPRSARNCADGRTRGRVDTWIRGWRRGLHARVEPPSRAGISARSRTS